MSFLPYDPSDQYSTPFSHPSPNSGAPAPDATPVHISAEKLKVPRFPKLVNRPRVSSLIARSEREFSGTLICGRSGTGKSALAVNYIQDRPDTAWLSLEPPDVDWRSFAAGVFLAVRRKKGSEIAGKSQVVLTRKSDIEEIAAFLDKLFKARRQLPSLLVLDNVHYIFDTEWFGDLFEQLMATIPESTHVLMLSRSKPSNPLWRLRSKRFLNVIDERVFAFDESETAELFKAHGFSQHTAKTVHIACFGNVSLMLSLAKQRKKNVSAR